MAIFYTDSGSFNDISVTGSVLVSGSLTVSGSVQLSTGGITGSHFGTSSWAGTASVALTASVVTTNTVSYTAGAGLSGGGSATLGGSSVTIDAVAGAGISLTAPTNDAINVDTGSAHFTGGVKSKLNTDGVISSSTQFTSLTAPFTGSFTGSHTGTFPYSGLTGTPTLVSSSTQFNSLTSPFTGSFTGSFTGTLTGTSSWAQSSSVATSSSFATTSSYVLPSGLPSGVISSSTQQVVSTYTNPTDNRVITSTGTGGITGEANLTFDGAVLAVNTNNAKYFQGGDDAALWDVNVANTVGVYGVQDTTVGAVKLGSSGPTLYGSSSGFVGIGTITPGASLHVQGNISASSFTGSLTGSHVGSLTGTASFATTASYALTSAGTVTNANTASYVTSNIGSGAPMVVNTNNGSGLVLQGTGNSQTAQLRIVSNGGGWVDGINTAYFQISSSTGNNVSFMGGTFGADAQFDRLQFNSKYTQISNGLYSASPLPGYVLQVLNLTASNAPVFGIFTTASQTANFFDITTSGSTSGNIFSIRSNGTVSASGNIEANINLVSNNSIADEGGQIELAKPQTNTSISGSLVIDIFQNKLRIFEKNSPNRGGYWDITALASGVGTNLVGGTGTVTAITASSGLTGGIITGTGTITLDTSSAHFITGSVGVLNTKGVISSSGQVDVRNTTGISTLATTGSNSFVGTEIISGSLIVSSSGLSVQVTGSTNIRDNLTVNGNTLFADATNNRVGIGTLSPANTLQVAGNVSASSYTSSINNAVGFVGTSSWANTASVVVTNTVSYTAGAGLSGGGTATLGGSSVTIDAVAGAGVSLTAPTNDAINVDTGSAHFTGGVKSKLNTDGVISSSTQFTSLTAPFTGSFTGSHTGTFPYSGLTGTPALVSSSTQFNSLTSPFTGSFTGSFSGSLRGSFIATGVPYIDVRTYGAVGNGTTDDYAAFSSSLAAITTAGGGTLYVPKGNYRIGTGLRITKNTTITGDGRENTIINCNHLTTLPGGAMLSGSDISNVVIEDLCLSGSGINGVSSIGIKFSLATTTNTDHVILRNLYVNDQAGDGISIATPILTTLQNVKVRYTSGDGFSVNGGTSTNFYDCFAITGVGAGFNLDTMTYCSLVGCASEVYGISYKFNNCSAISLVSCGSEDPIDRSGANPGYTGIAFRNSEISTGSRVSLYSCYSRDPRTPAPNGHISGSFQIFNFRAVSGSQVLTPLKIYGNSEFVGQLSASAYTSSIVGSVGFLGTASVAVSASWAPGGSGTVGPGTVNSIALFDTATTVSSSTIFQSSGNVGIGISTPSNKLQIAGNVSASAYTSSIVGAVGFVGTASYALQTAGAGGGVTSVTAGSGLSGGTITSTGTIALDTSSAHFISGSQKVTASRAISASYADTFSGYINFPSGLEVTGSLIVSGSTRLTGSLFLSASDTTATNKVLVLNTTTGQVFTTASVGTGGSGTVGPGTSASIALFNSTSTVSSSIITQLNGAIGINNTNPVAELDIDGINSQDIIFGTSDLNDYVEINIQNINAGATASSDLVATSNIGGNIGGFIDVGINSSTYALAGNVGGANDGYLYMTSSNGELYIGNATPGAGGNIKFFGGGLDGDLNTHMFISSSGRVGINTTASLGADLQVFGNISASSYTSSLNNRVGFFGTSSFAVSASWAPGGSGTTFPFTGNAVITGSLQVSGSSGGLGGITGSLLGTSSLALNVPVGTILTASVGSGSLFNILEMSMATSGTIAVTGGGTASLDLNKVNYFIVSASGTGTVNWVITNPPALNRAQTFVVRYTNGGAVTNTWFTGTRWSGGTAPTLTSGANPDLLGFITDDSGSNWRGVLLQRSSS